MFAGVCFPSAHTLLLPDMTVERRGSARLFRPPVFVVLILRVEPAAVCLSVSLWD